RPARFSFTTSPMRSTISILDLICSTGVMLLERMKDEGGRMKHRVSSDRLHIRKAHSDAVCRHWSTSILSHSHMGRKHQILQGCDSNCTHALMSSIVRSG